MRQGFGYFAAWLAATATAVAGSWFGCGLVLREASPPAPTVLSSVQSRHVVGLAGSLAATMVPPEAAPRTAATTLGPAPTATPTRVASTTQPSAPRPRRSRAGGWPPYLPPIGHPTFPVLPAPDAVIRTYQTKGGVATLRFTPTRVDVVGTVPSPGYQFYVGRDRNNHLLVVFARSDRESDLDATWDHGPRADITEYWW
ncbi:MAG TPA: hypothetical protein VLJ59_18640 [Mycobacteriales bacterium]|nr:hypothetical protein [Mycobacteriales bacterium]